MSLAKTNARKCAVQALYQWQMSGESLTKIEQNFLEEGRLKGAQESFFAELIHQVSKNLETIDPALAEFVDRPVDNLDPVEKAVLRLGVYELLMRLDTPYKVIINESVNLAKCFGADGSHKYVNSVLDKIGQKNRQVEIKAKAKK